VSSDTVLAGRRSHRRCSRHQGSQADLAKGRIGGSRPDRVQLVVWGFYRDRREETNYANS
jgi:hypothetical protein